MKAPPCHLTPHRLPPDSLLTPSRLPRHGFRQCLRAGRSRRFTLWGARGVCEQHGWHSSWCGGDEDQEEEAARVPARLRSFDPADCAGVCWRGRGPAGQAGRPNCARPLSLGSSAHSPRATARNHHSSSTGALPPQAAPCPEAPRHTSTHLQPSYPAQATIIIARTVVYMPEFYPSMAIKGARAPTQEHTTSPSQRTCAYRSLCVVQPQVVNITPVRGEVVVAGCVVLTASREVSEIPLRPA